MAVCISEFESVRDDSEGIAVSKHLADLDDVDCMMAFSLSLSVFSMSAM